MHGTSGAQHMDLAFVPGLYQAGGCGNWHACGQHCWTTCSRCLVTSRALPLSASHALHTHAAFSLPAGFGMCVPPCERQRFMRGP